MGTQVAIQIDVTNPALTAADGIAKVSAVDMTDLAQEDMTISADVTISPVPGTVRRTITLQFGALFLQAFPSTAQQQDYWDHRNVGQMLVERRPHMGATVTCTVT